MQLSRLLREHGPHRMEHQELLSVFRLWDHARVEPMVPLIDHFSSASWSSSVSVSKAVGWVPLVPWMPFLIAP